MVLIPWYYPELHRFVRSPSQNNEWDLQKNFKRQPLDVRVRTVEDYYKRAQKTDGVNNSAVQLIWVKIHSTQRTVCISPIQCCASTAIKRQIYSLTNKKIRRKVR